MFKVIYDNGKPYEIVYNSEEEMIKGLKDFYERNKDDDYPFDIKVYDEKDEDISESQFITEIIGDIINE